MKIASLIRTSLVVSMALIASGMAAQEPVRAEVARTQQARPVDNAELDFELVNNTGYDLAHLYMSPAAKDTWGENILEEGLSDGDSVHLSFHPQASATVWDLRADWLMEEESEEQEYVYWKKLDLSKITTMTLHYDEESGKTWATFE